LSPRAFIACVAIVVIVMPLVASFVAPPAKADQMTGAAATMPSDTDPRIKSFNEPHISWLPEGRPRNQVLVFLPGTGGQPSERMPFAKTGCALGYHVISLMYPDNVAAQQACARSDDPDAHIKFREAIIKGGDFQYTHVEQQDCIENRLTKLLLYLSTKNSKDGWDQFLDSNKQINWNKVIISGQSQGGGHAYVISKDHTLARVLMFGSPKDYSFYFKRPAKGFDSNTKTPLKRYFAFNHVEDNANGCSHDQQSEIFQQLGLDHLGEVTAEQAKGNYNHAHLIYTDAPVDGGKYHGSVIKGQLPVCVPVWKYMLTEPVD
jgi:hypothetical protein